jgi:hypothetical protein
MAADEEGEEPKQVEHKGDHEPRLWPDGADRSTTWLRDKVLARDKSCRGSGGRKALRIEFLRPTTVGASQVQWSSTVQAWIGLVARLPWYSSVRENGG